MDKTRVILTTLVLINLVTPVLAQDDLPDAGILPDSPFYGLKRGWERAIEVLTFSPEAKALVNYGYVGLIAVFFSLVSLWLARKLQVAEGA